VDIPRSDFKIITGHQNIMESKQNREPELLFLGLSGRLLGHAFGCRSIFDGTGFETERTLGCTKHLRYRGFEHLDSLKRLFLELLVLGELGQAYDKVSKGTLGDNYSETIVVDLGDVIVGEIHDRF
jgi:hypothetical protein